MSKVIQLFNFYFEFIHLLQTSYFVAISKTYQNQVLDKINFEIGVTLLLLVFGVCLTVDFNGCHNPCFLKKVLNIPDSIYEQFDISNTFDK